MTQLKINWKNWVLVCDGAKALFLRNDGDAEILNLILVHETAEPAEAARTLGSDRPGRVYASKGGARSAVEDVDLHERTEESFLKAIAAQLDKFVHDGTIEHLTLVAPPKALGILRKHISPSVQGAITAELAKDLTKLPIDEIEARLRSEA
ncbi:host attachment protein [Rhizobium paranaense]|uniref:Protein required for attachment to host cells n=1 Tax=Rhizobium paranaense TaxID=1650438 RepID=A0A7W8XUS9_9HYPH|nr:host attachment family protein [Rhizobium paranaense]MBB5575965.1 protein required for attachment to host cells [Rhizobium paranaense]